MKIIENWNEIKDFSEVTSLPVGPQPCVIKAVFDDTEKMYLNIEFDIVKGDFKGYFADWASRQGGKWPTSGSMKRSYKNEEAMKFFKASITAIEKSNPPYDFEKSSFDEKTLVGKYVVVNFREEEYVNNGELKVAVTPFEFRSIEALKEGKVKIGARKVLSEEDKAKLNPVTTTETPVATIINDDDLPF